MNDVMDYSATYRDVIANNISNVNTPGYKTQTISFDSVLESEGRLALKTDDNKHISNGVSNYDSSALPKYSIKEESSGNAKVDGNNVDTTAEMIKMLQNNSVYTMSVNALNKEFSLIKTAIGQ